MHPTMRKIGASRGPREPGRQTQATWWIRASSLRMTLVESLVAFQAETKRLYLVVAPQMIALRTEVR
jgi:hypothetical protein